MYKGGLGHLGGCGILGLEPRAGAREASKEEAGGVRITRAMI